MNEKIYRVAHIGCGTVAPNHLAALAENPRTQIAALCDLDADRAKNMAEKYAKDAMIYTDYRKMLDEVKPDSVHISTPHFLHCEMACYALSKGIHVFLEKPMVRTKEEIRILLDAEKSSSAKLNICFQNRFNPSTEYAMQIAEEDGGVTAAYGTVIWDRDEDYYRNSPWRGRYATEGGGVMINQAIHTIDLLCFFLGKPKSVCATTANHRLKGVIEVEDTCEGVITFDNGKRANFYCTNSHIGKSHTEVMLETAHHTIEIRSPYVTVDGQVITACEKKSGYVGKECYGNGHKYLIAKFYDALAEGKDAPVTAESSRYAIDILTAAYNSHDSETEIVYN
ncbi:MAG: Gfo/Idh/MocA family oxidoreductase [Clostridia bacterium]|nr:Gfo/Idh/MocA family oxidoreductase [Clostridia bacterium]